MKTGRSTKYRQINLTRRRWERQRFHASQAVAAMAASLHTATLPEEVYAAVLGQLLVWFHADGAALVIRDPLLNQSLLFRSLGIWKPYEDIQPEVEEFMHQFDLFPGKPFVDNTIQQQPRLAHSLLLEGVAAVACMPLYAGNEQVGAVWVGRKNAIGDHEIACLAQTGAVAASAIQRALLYAQSSQYARQLATATDIGRALTETFSLHEIYAGLARAVIKMLPDICTVYISRFDPETETITCAFAIQDGEELDAANFPPLKLEPPGKGLQSEVIRQRTPMVVNDLRSRLRFVSRVVYVGRAGDGYTQSAVYAPMVAKGEIYGVIQAQSLIINRFRKLDAELLALVGNTAAIAIQNAGLFDRLQGAHRELVDAYDATIEGWGKALEMRDRGTHGHTRRVVDLTLQLARRLGVVEPDLSHIRRGALLHDIGKMGIPDRVLLKPGSLSSEEWALMYRHPEFAYELLKSISYLKPALDIPYCHHERWDGTGYPRALQGTQIPLAARIFAVIDVWDALTSDRPYSKAWEPAAAIQAIRQQAGRHFDPRIVEVFETMIESMSGDSS